MFGYVYNISIYNVEYTCSKPYYNGLKIKDNEVAGYAVCVGEKINACRI